MDISELVFFLSKAHNPIIKRHDYLDSFPQWCSFLPRNQVRLVFLAERSLETLKSSRKDFPCHVVDSSIYSYLPLWSSQQYSNPQTTLLFRDLRIPRQRLGAGPGETVPFRQTEPGNLRGSTSDYSYTTPVKWKYLKQPFLNLKHQSHDLATSRFRDSKVPHWSLYQNPRSNEVTFYLSITRVSYKLRLGLSKHYYNFTSRVFRRMCSQARQAGSL